MKTNKKNNLTPSPFGVEMVGRGSFHLRHVDVHEGAMINTMIASC